MTSRALAWRTVTARPARAALAITGVAVIGALLFDMLLLSRGLLVSLRDLLDAVGYDVRVVATDTLPDIGIPIAAASKLVAEISKLPEVEEVAVVRRSRVTVSVPGRAPVRAALVGVSGTADRRAWRIARGRNLSAFDGAASGPPPVVVSGDLAEALGLAPGSTVQLRGRVAGAASALPPVGFEVIGIAEFDVEAGDGFVAATTSDGFLRVQAQGESDDAEVVLVLSRDPFGAEAAAAAIKRLRPDLRAYSNEQLVDQFNRDGFAYFRQISFVLSAITLGFAFLLVATLLSVSVNQRLHEVAALRALGLTRRRIAAALVWESIWLVASGGLLSLVLGGVLALELDRILRAMPGLPERLHFFVFEPRALVLHVALLAVTALGAAVYPVWVATRLPIAATLRRETIS
jgi:putative ABC transport system permease protein